MNTTTPQQIMQRWQIVQGQLIPALHQEIGSLTPKLEKLIHILEWSRIEEFVKRSSYRTGRPPHELAWLANAFVAKVVLGLTTTVHLIERLSIDKALQRICGFPLHKKLPSASTFSRAFDTFAKDKLAERTHEALIKTHFKDRLIGHISRDGTTIEARERPQRNNKEDTDELKPKGRPRKEEKRPVKLNASRQRTQCLEEMLKEIPTDCRRGTKCNAQGVPISALLSSASMHDSRAAIPLSHISAKRVTNLYDLMDAAYCSIDLHEHCRELGHVPLIDHNPRGGKKEEFEPADAVRYRERSGAERANGRLKDEFGGRHIWVRGAVKVMSHLMFGILVLSVDQLLRLRQ
jgi:hypothetical protein